jgi:hypothetical protein
MVKLLIGAAIVILALVIVGYIAIFFLFAGIDFVKRPRD